MRRLADFGEHFLIERIARLARAGSGRHVVLGIGDDGAVLRPRAGEDLVVSCDTLVESVHFRWQTQSPRALGRRALAVNLSDLAAMGARPLGCTVALAAPPELTLRRFDGLLAGLLDEARRFACPLVGGNLARAGETQIAVTVLGAVSRGRALRRDAARAGDGLWVTGSLGGAALALARAERGRAPLRAVPEPRVPAGLALVRMRGRGACIDVSDGLVADLSHLLAPPGLGAELEPERLPRPRGFAGACARLGLEPDVLAFTGGEDYELLFPLRPPDPTPAALARRLGVGVTRIGRITRRPGIRGLPRLPGGGGWQHF